MGITYVLGHSARWTVPPYEHNFSRLASPDVEGGSNEQSGHSGNNRPGAAVTPARLSTAIGWAVNGALAGAGAAAVLMWVDRQQYHALQNLTFLLLPGMAFGLAVSVPLWRLGQAVGWSVAVFMAGSIIAWPAGYYAGVRVLVAIETPGPSRLALAGLAGGLVWSAILTAAILVFPFMRAGRVWPILVIAGGLTGALCVSLLEILGQWGFGAVYLVLWGVWYAVYGGLIASALPGKGNET